jgi:hypothetical protein
VQLFKKTDPHALEPAWSHKVKGAIWRIHPTMEGVFVGEERRTDQKLAAFFCLQCQDGRELWQIASPGDSWWIGIEAVYRDVVILHGFASPNLPLHRGIIAVDLFSGKKLWENPELEFAGFSDEFVVGARETSSGRSPVLLNRRSGDQCDPGAADHPLALIRGEQQLKVRFPVPLEQLDTSDTRVESIVRRILDREPLFSSVEALKWNDLVIFDHHELSGRGKPENPLFTGVITVVEQVSGTVVYRDTVTNEVPTVLPELFFVQHDVLYYIKDRRTLMAIRLAS